MRLRFALIAAALALSTALVAPPARSADNDVTRATLTNGLRVVIVRNALAPVVTTELNYLVGSDEAPAGFPGTAHAQEHMMFRSSTGLSATQLADISASLGGDFNADTQDSITQYFFTIPAEYLPVALHIEAARMTGAMDSQTEWSQERGAIEQEVAADLSNSFYRFYSTAIADIFAGTPYAHDALGTRPSFDKTTGALLRKFHDAWYAPNNAILVIAGDVDPQTTLASVKQLFGPIPSKKLPPRPHYDFQALTAKTINVASDLPVPIILVTYRLPGFDSPDYAAAQIMGDVLGSQRGDLFALAAEGKALQTGFEGNTLPHAGLGFAYAAIPPGGDSAAMSQTLKGVIANYLQNGFPAELVEAAKRKEIASSEFNRNSIEGLANVWSQALAVEGRMSPDDDVAMLSKVTVDNVNRVARKYLLNDTAVVGILTPKPAGKAAAARGFGGAESFAPKQTKSAALPDWAARALAKVKVPKSTTNPTTFALPNGLKLVVQPESISPTVTVVGEVKHEPDLQEPQGKDGVDGVLGGMFLYGTTSLDRLAYQKALDDIAANESGGASFSLSVLSDHFDRGMQLLADNVLHPALPASAFAIVQQQSAQATAGQLTSPEYLTARAVSKALYPPSDPALREATPATISALKLDDVQSYYASTFRPDETTIVVIGDVSPTTAYNAVAQWFGGWKATGPKPVTDLPPVPASKTSSATVPATGRIQDSVQLVETIDLPRTAPDFYPMEMGESILGGGFYATRLAHDVREVAGLVYSIGTSVNAGKTRTTFAVRYACDPPKVSGARAIVLRDLRAMQTSDPSPREMQLARALLIRAIPLAESSEDDIASGLLRRSLQDLPLDEPLRAASRYMVMTPREVQAAFAKYLRVGDLAQIVQGPPPH